MTSIGHFYHIVSVTKDLKYTKGISKARGKGGGGDQQQTGQNVSSFPPGNNKASLLPDREHDAV